VTLTDEEKYEILDSIIENSLPPQPPENAYTVRDYAERCAELGIEASHEMAYRRLKEMWERGELESGTFGRERYFWLVEEGKDGE
jgi:hypothetical protein